MSLEIDCCSEKGNLGEVALWFFLGISFKPLNKALPEDLDFFLGVQKRFGRSLMFKAAYEPCKDDLLEDFQTSKGLVYQNEIDLRLLNLVYHPN